ncbi:MAG: phosphate ABC transporter substrate-binding protein PstS family protein [Actinobacteria bacterium]|nr:phosphate ABC transporter substrate-binding protein PstS family protein [Actinomycetota bacterium]
MHIAKRPRARLLVMFVALSVLTAACAGGEDSAGTGTETTTGSGSGAATGGTVNISGSSTVLPVSQLVAESYADAGNDANVNVDGPGTGDGFQLFCQGETDISDASRPIKEAEVATCEENGIEFVELYIAIDGLSVISNADFDAVECLSFADMYALSGPESQGFDNWTDAQAIAEELGSDTEFPDAPLNISAPGEESGTYDSYVEIVLEDIAEERGQEAQTRPDYQSSGDDNIILQGIQGSPSSYGWVGYAYFAENEGAVKAFEVAEEPGGECVAPTPETIASGDYPISRPLFIYVNAEKAESNPALAPFVDFYLSEEGMAAVAEAGYVDIPEEDLEATRQTWEDRTTGANFASE